MGWATRWALAINGVPSRVTAFVTWVAVLPVVGRAVELDGSPVALIWISAGAAIVGVLLFARSRELPHLTREEKRLAARVVLDRRRHWRP